MDAALKELLRLSQVEIGPYIGKDCLGLCEVVVVVKALAHFEVGHGEVIAHTHFFSEGKAALPVFLGGCLFASEPVVNTLKSQCFGETYPVARRLS